MQKLLDEIRGNAMTVYGKARKSKEKENTSYEVEVFTFKSITAATNNFSAANKLGEGGFGPVYKGILSDRQEVAIKRLSKSSGQGLIEFKNEAKLMAKLQHTNLVKLLGFCIQNDERILVYEYMPNKSLDFYLFDSTRKNLLDWKKRLNIIGGIAQGLLYLHKYSRLRVIHRDLKASNILLDEEMNPKISDFGIARIFGKSVSEENTNRVVGTYGYMAPEYAIYGVVSIKTDVFSFGVLLLEILSGKKNRCHYHSDCQLNFIGYAWQLWNEGRALELVDPALNELSTHNEVLRCIHIGLLCVQVQATDRPTMSDIVSFLSNDTIQLPQPKQSAFFINVVVEESELPYSKQEHHSLNDVTNTSIYGR
ncbi:cysteine-rich receptor-like protein kinase 10 [Gastrolobium bilobum]|uniref:cysteine-rich receptor-like protein kinase 10 n=1 Tax=Gastrolobium bilobum TaxID=150636 RepID=UPI002AB1E79D|nr:cysteine-rich receptor-like protein kinase 10 [Gastrolobium bilobum]